MAKKKVPKVHVQMEVSGKDDKWRVATIGGITKASANSALMKVPEINSGVATLGALGKTLQDNNATVAADRAQLALDLQTESNTRNQVDVELVALKGLVEARGQPGDAATIGMTERGKPPAKGPLVAPEVIDIKFPKKYRGRFDASVREVGTTKGRYAAEWSPEPITPTSSMALPGYGKSRTITGASGTKVWVRFARVRGQSQSEWSTPVLVTIP